MLYNHTRNFDEPLPLLIGFTSATNTISYETDEQTRMYDPVKQVVVWSMGKLHDTRSERIVAGTKKGCPSVTERKNMNDDKKYY